MIVNHEKTAPAAEVTGQFARRLTVLLSPALHPELESIAAGLTLLPPEGKSDDHIHPEGEIFYVVAGRGRIAVGAEQTEVSPGSAVWGPPNISHQLINDSRDPMKILWVLCPPGREKGIIENAMKRNEK
jgi:quercetin dioxygenase-like cupin family protein